MGLKSKPKPSSDECSSTFSSDLEDMFGMTKGDTNNSSKTSTCFETVPDKDLITASGDNLAESRELRRKRSPATREYIKKLTIVILIPTLIHRRKLPNLSLNA